LEILYILLVLLIVTRIGGEIAERLRLPALVGELVGGIVLGAVVASYSETFPVLADLTDNEVFSAITDLGIFFLMLLGGIELSPRSLAKSSGSGLAVGLGGLFLPLAAGFGLGWMILPASDVRVAQSLFLGTALAITAVPVAIKVLMDLDRLDSPAGRLIVSAAVFDDILSLILLAVLTGVIESGELPDALSLLGLLGQVVLFFVIATALGRLGFPWFARIMKRAKVEEFEFSALLVAALAYAVLAEALGMHFIIGAFLAGLFFSRRNAGSKVFEDVEGKLSGITTGFLAPVFFASIGLHLDFSALATIPWILIGVIVIAILGKLIGAGLPAYFAGIGTRDSLVVGTGMSGRGAVELIVADIALRAGLFSQPEPVPQVVASLFSAVVIMAVVTTLFTPIMLRILDRDG